MTNRPRGRPEKATPAVKQLISDIYVELSKKGERPYVDDVYKELGVRLAERKMPLALAKSTVRRIMQELKDEAGRIRNDEWELDQPWSIGASVTHGIPPDLTPTLLEIRRWCILTGQSLSLRQAKWVAYLQHTAGMEPNTIDTRIASLHHYACRYALREKSSKLLGKATVDTSDLDIGRMQWDHWVRHIAEQTKAIIPRIESLKVYLEEFEELYLVALAEAKKRGQVPEPSLVPRDWVLSITDPELAINAILGIHHPPKPPGTAPEMAIRPGTDSPDIPVDTEPLDMQSKEIYALCIFYLSKGPIKWDSLTEENRDWMAAALKNEIHIHQLKVQIAREKPRQNLTGLSFTEFLRGPHPRFEDWTIPDDYLRTVGYEAPEKKGEGNA